MKRPKLESVREQCLKCDRVTTWAASKRGDFQRCDGCGMRFPCAACWHLECRLARNESLMEWLNNGGQEP